jgi:toxin ParE1/3/4
MTASAPAWPVRMAAGADEDYRRILHWTSRAFGLRQARSYAATLDAALLALMDAPQIAGAKPRPEIGKGLLTLHVQRGRRKGRHLLLFRVGRHEGRPCIDVLRLLHDMMDLQRHGPDAGGVA